ncbi:hypothetical protein Sgri01_01573 [Streptomyces griseus]
MAAPVPVRERPEHSGRTGAGSPGASSSYPCRNVRGVGGGGPSAVPLLGAARGGRWAKMGCPVLSPQGVSVDAHLRSRLAATDDRRCRAGRRGVAYDGLPRPQRDRKGRSADQGTHQAGRRRARIPAQPPGPAAAPGGGEGHRARLLDAVRGGRRAVAARVLHGDRRRRRGERAAARLRPGARTARAVGFRPVLRRHRRRHRRRAGRERRRCGAVEGAGPAVRVAGAAGVAGRHVAVRRSARRAGRRAAVRASARAGRPPARADRRLRLAPLLGRRASRVRAGRRAVRLGARRGERPGGGRRTGRVRELCRPAG